MIVREMAVSSRSLLPLGVLLAVGSSLHAQTLISEYTFDSASDPLVVTSSDTEAFSTSGDIFSGGGASISRYTGSVYNTSDQITDAELSMMTLGATSATNSLADAVDNNVFFGFTITPQYGYRISLSEFQGGTRRSANSSTRGWLLRSDASGTTDLASDSSISSARTSGLESMTPDTIGVPVSPGTNTSFDTVSLSQHADLQNITGPITLWIYVNPGTGSDSFGRTVDFDNIRVYGSVAPVPEPSQFLLAAIPVVLLFLRRRRREV